MTVQRLVTLLVLLGIVYGIKSWYLNRTHQARRQEVARMVNSVFDRAQVTVHGCYPYEGLSYQEAVSPNRLVAFDVEIKNLTEAPDFNDIDVVDADKNENYGSDPDIIPLDEDAGTTYTKKSWPTDLARIRVMLVYALPQRVKRINLSYWAKPLTYAPVAIDENGRNKVNPPKGHILGNNAWEKKFEEKTSLQVERTTVAP